jgi:Phosphoglycerol transferase and related proteins, alkaline phosphatase superfamily
MKSTIFMKNPNIWILVISMMPFMLWFSLNEKSNNFGHLDSLTISFFTALSSTLLLLISKTIGIWFLCICSFIMSLFTYIVYEYYSFYEGYISVETLLLINDFLIASGQFISLKSFIYLTSIITVTFFIAKSIVQTDIQHSSVLKSIVIYSLSLFLTSFSHLKYSELPHILKKMRYLSYNLKSNIVLARSTEFWRPLII